MVFIGSDEYNGVDFRSGRQAKACPAGWRHRDTENFLQLVDRPRRAGGTGQEAVIRRSIDSPADDAFRLAHPAIAGAARGAVFAMGIGIVPHHAFDLRLDLAQGPAGCRVIGIQERLAAKRGREHPVGTDKAVADSIETVGTGSGLRHERLRITSHYKNI